MGHPFKKVILWTFVRWVADASPDGREDARAAPVHERFLELRKSLRFAVAGD